MSITPNSVPRLNLEPKVKRPLSLLNPLDYLRLLYWVFCVPQALRLYVDPSQNNLIPVTTLTWEKIFKRLQHETIERQLILQGIVLIVLIWLPIFFYFQDKGIVINTLGVISCLLLGIIVGCCLAWGVSHRVSIAWCIASGFGAAVAFTITFSIFNITLFNLITIIANHPSNKFIKMLDLRLANNMALGLWSGITWGISWGVAWCVGLSVISGVILNISRSCLIGISLPIWILLTPMNYLGLMNIGDRLWYSLIFVISFIISSLIIIKLYMIKERFRVALAFSRKSYLYRSGSIKRNLYKQLELWLLEDWETGLYNADQILRYTLKSKIVIEAISNSIIKINPDQIVYHVSKLAHSPYDWRLIESICQRLIELEKNNNNLIQSTLNNYVVTARATKGLWYLHESVQFQNNMVSLEIKYIEESLKTFTEIRSLPYGEELYMLAQTLAAFANAGELAVATLLRLPTIPQEPILRTSTWEVINSLHQVVQSFREIQSKVSHAVKLSALKRALIELDQVKNKVDLLPEAERFLIKYIVITWQDSLERFNKQLEHFSINSEVRNPYIIGDPVQGQSFVGRKDILERLEQVWVSNKQLQSIVLFGHRRMGKTSILRNISTRLDEKVKLAYVNLLTVGNSIQGVGEVLMAIADSLSDTLQIPPPDDESLINLPYRTFERYLKQIETQLGDTGLIIALDEFEQIEELIKSDRIPKDFMGVLRGMVQMSPKIAFALAGLHTLEEMTEDYFNPFFASIIPIRVSFLERATCRYLLANPSEDFPLDYKPDALDYIYDLTAGQPYLVQLIGFLLVRRYNDQVFELGNKRDPMFTIADVDGIINQPEFYQNGRYYFTGVWQQAGEGSPGQQNIIKAIAPHPTGLDFNTLQTITNLDPNSLQNALDTLSRHDVITETDHHWKIIVELFRRWVINSVKLNLLT